MSLGSNGVDRVRSLRKFRCDFVARTFVLIAPVQPVLHRASCSNETIENASKHYETQPNMDLGPNGVDRVHSLRKIPKRLHGTNLCINCTSSTHFHRVPCSNETLPNAPKHYKMHQNISLWTNGVDWVRSLWKIPMRHRGTNLCINCTSSTCFAQSLCSNETLPNAPKHYETHQNMSLRSNGVGRVHLLRKKSKTTSRYKLVH